MILTEDAIVRLREAGCRIRENPAHFDMSYWACHTVACLAGWVCHLDRCKRTQTLDFDMSRTTTEVVCKYGYTSIPDAALDLLGVKGADRKILYSLFYPGGWAPEVQERYFAEARKLTAVHRKRIDDEITDEELDKRVSKIRVEMAHLACEAIEAFIAKHSRKGKKVRHET